MKTCKLKSTALIALMLVVALIGTVTTTPNAQTTINANALAVAEYPEMAKYPEHEMQIGFDNRYDEWWADQKKQRSFYGAGEGLDGFFTKTFAEFLSDSENKNAVYSPLNVYMALAMLAETTEGESRAQILDLLDADNIEALRKQANFIWNANYSDDGAVTSILASSLWLNKDITFKQSTLKLLADKYYASSYSGEMGSAELNSSIKDWMNEQTGGLLKDYISGIELSPETIMALVTTIYFQAKWENEFSERKTVDDIFHTANGDITCKFMNTTETYGNYYWSDTFSATRLSLQNSGNMWFILPDANISIDELLKNEAALSLMCQDTSNINRKSLKVNISLPKFDVSSKMDLTKGLNKLGITNCFSASSADFSPLLETEQPIWLDKVEHGARVVIDEEGVTAAAYTEMVMCGAAMPPEEEVDFVLDRPFIFVITGSDGLPLFAGVVNNPA
ncbi:MAG: serpin family protein [Clostridia bacterium]|nr:serpin family protein [Clostridia bacterium]